MKVFSRLFVSAAPVLLAGFLAGCVAGGQQAGGHSQSDMGMMDAQSMCDMHKSMMDEHMKSMSPEMRTRMQAMHEKCKPM